MSVIFYVLPIAVNITCNHSNSNWNKYHIWQRKYYWKVTPDESWVICTLMNQQQFEKELFRKSRAQARLASVEDSDWIFNFQVTHSSFCYFFMLPEPHIKTKHGCLCIYVALYDSRFFSHSRCSSNVWLWIQKNTNVSSVIERSCQFS